MLLRYGTKEITRNFLIAGAYLVGWCALDYVGFLFEIAPGVSPWYPPHGLSIAFLLAFGLRFWPWLLAGPMIMGSLVWLRGEYLALILLSATICSGYALAVLALKRFEFHPDLKTMRDALIFLSVGTLASLYVAASSVLAFASLGLVLWEDYFGRFIAFWAGDTLGVICLAPFLFTVVLPWLRRQAGGGNEPALSRPTPSSRGLFVSQMAVTALCVLLATQTWTAFANPPLYLLFVPTIWIAATQGAATNAASVAGVTIAVVTVLRLVESPLPVADVQLFMAALCASAICLAALVEERRTIIQSLDRTNRELERSNADLERFAYAASHDLHQPLRTVAGFAALLKERWRERLDRTDKEYFDLIENGVEAGQKLIRGLLTFSRAHGKEAEIAETDFNAVMETALGNLETLISENRAEIVYDRLPVLPVREAQMVQLFQNLIQNALTYRSTEAPRIRIVARQQQNEWRFSFSDNGIGIDPTYAEQIFEPFRRLHTTSTHPGSGLGLSICKRIVETHGGRIGIDNGSLNGTTFWFMIPIEQNTVV